jgi:hypothetical protein
LFPCFIAQVLSYGREWRVAALAHQLDPSSPLAAVLAADYALACEDVPAALALLKTAGRVAEVAGPARVSQRERLYVHAFKTYVRPTTLYADF